MRWLWIIMVAVLTVTADGNLAWSAGESGQPQSVVEDLLKTVREVHGDGTVAPENTDKSLKHASSLIDVENISGYALEGYWDRLSQSQQKAFVDLFTNLLEVVAYPNTAEFLSDLEVSYRKEKTVGSKAMVYTSIIHEKEGRVDIDFKLANGGGNWLITDVLLDGVSLARNLRTQCRKIISENSYDELLRRMEKKLRDKDSEDFGDITAKN